MNTPLLLGASDATLGAILGALWTVTLAVVGYRRAAGECSRERFYAVASAAAVWLSYSVLQISTAFSGAAEAVAVAVSVGLLCTGAGLGIGWWRLRNDAADEEATA